MTVIKIVSMDATLHVTSLQSLLALSIDSICMESYGDPSTASWEWSAALTHILEY